MRINDPHSMRALAHPVRLDLVELLGTLGTATAAVCARHLGETQANCSFHLRQLAKYGFVEQAEASGDSRERPWRLIDADQSWSPTDTDTATAMLERAFLQREVERILAWPLRSQSLPAEWHRAGGFGGATIPLTATEADTLGDDLRRVIEPYLARLNDPAKVPAHARFVRVLIATTPLAEAPRGDTP